MRRSMLAVMAAALLTLAAAVPVLAAPNENADPRANVSAWCKFAQGRSALGSETAHDAIGENCGGPQN